MPAVVSSTGLALIASYLPPPSSPAPTAAGQPIMSCRNTPLAFLAAGPRCRRSLEQMPHGCVLLPKDGLTTRMLLTRTANEHDDHHNKSHERADDESIASRPSIFYSKRGSCYYSLKGREAHAADFARGLEAPAGGGLEEWGGVLIVSSVNAPHRMVKCHKKEKTAVSASSMALPVRSVSYLSLQHAAWWLRRPGPARLSLSLHRYSHEETESILSLFSSSDENEENTAFRDCHSPPVSEICLRSRNVTDVDALTRGQPEMRSLSLQHVNVTTQQLKTIPRRCKDLVKLSLAMNSSLSSTGFLCPTPSGTASTVSSARRGGNKDGSVSRDRSTTPPLSDRRQPVFIVRPRDTALGEGTSHSNSAAAAKKKKPTTQASRGPPHNSLVKVKSAPFHHSEHVVRVSDTKQNKKKSGKEKGHSNWARTLRELDLSYTSLTDIDTLHGVPAMKELRALSLEGCVSLSRISFLPALRHLVELNLSDTTALTADTFCVLADCASLQTLVLSGCSALQDISWLLEKPRGESNHGRINRIVPNNNNNNNHHEDEIVVKKGINGAAHSVAKRVVHHDGAVSFTLVPKIENAAASSATNDSNKGAAECANSKEGKYPLCRALQKLFLDRTGLHDDGLRAPASFDMLEVLSLRGCAGITNVNRSREKLDNNTDNQSLDAYSIIDAPWLKELDLSETNITHDGVPEDLDNVKVLRMRSCNRLDTLTDALLPVLQEIDLTGSKAISKEKILRRLDVGESADHHEENPPEFWRQLQRVALRSCDRLSTIECLRPCVSVKELDLYHTEVTEEALVSALRDWCALQVLNIASTRVTTLSAWGPPVSGVNGWDGSLMSAPSPPLFLSTLRHLDISSTSVSEKGLGFIGASCPLLEVLHLRKCTNLTSLRFLSSFKGANSPTEKEKENATAEEEEEAPALPALIELIVTDAMHLTQEDSVSYIAAHCPQLRKLSLARCAGIFSVSELSSKLLCLVEMDLAGVSAITMNGLMMHVKPPPPQLAPISKQQSHDETVICHVDPCSDLLCEWPTLQTLRLRHCPSVNNASWVERGLEVARVFPVLTTLQINE